MLRAFNFETGNEAWKGLANEFLNREQSPEQNSRAGTTYEFLHTVFSIADPRQRWATSRSPALNPAFAIAEIVWMLNGREDAASLNYFNSQLPKFAGRTQSYPGAYGHRLRTRFGIDQLNRAYESLKANHESRQVILQIWDTKVDMPNADGTATSDDIPCNISSMLKIRQNRLEWTQIMRSNDLFRGLPHNLIQFTSIQEVFAGWLGTHLGSYIHFADSLHVYKTDLPKLSKMGSPTVLLNSDDLRLPKKESDSAFLELSRMLDLSTAEKMLETKMMDKIRDSKLPTSHRNFACILFAESARRRGFHDLESFGVELCTNRLFVEMFLAWKNRVSRTKKRIA